MVVNEKLTNVIEKWLMDISSDGQLGRSTFSVYSFIAHRHLCPYFKNAMTETLTDADIAGFVRFLHTAKANEKPLSERYIGQISSILNRIIRYAQERGLCTQIHTRIKITKTKGRKGRCFREEYIRRFTDHAMNSNNPRKIGFVLCLYLGLRCGEICALRWEDINLTEGCVAIRRTAKRILAGGGETHYIWTIGHPKSESSFRDIPIPDFLWEKLKELRKHVHSEKCFFLNGREDRFVLPRSYERSFKSSLESLSIPSINLHSLRHSFATRCIQNGIDIKTVSELLGHSSTEITLNIYVHPSMEQKRKAVNSLH